MKRQHRAIIVGVVALVILAVIGLLTYLHSANIPVLEPQGPVAAGERAVIFITLALCAIVVVPVFVLLFVFAWKYRADSPTSRHEHNPEWDHGSPLLEFSWWLVPSVIVVALAILAWHSTHALDPYIPLKGTGEPISVEVIALDWKWLFIYPEEGIASVNLLEFPENSPVHFELTADAPMNSFWIPSLGGQIMVMPGMTTQLNLMATDLGSFRGYSAEISGQGFAGMAFTAKAVSQADFDAWVASVQQSGSPLTLDAYDALAQPSSYNALTSYSPVDPSLYTTVVDRTMMPAAATSSMPSMNAATSMNDSMNDMQMPMNMQMDAR